MAGAEYTKGEMDIAEQERTFQGFMTGTLWGGLIIALVLSHATFTLAMGLHWMVSLALCLVGGVIAGMVMSMGPVWLLTVGALTVTAIIVQAIIGLFGLF